MHVTELSSLTNAEESYADNPRDNSTHWVLVYFEQVERYKFWWTIGTTLINSKNISYMYLLLAASVEGTQTSQTHSETVNAKEVELKIMYILVRARILQTWLDVLDLCVFLLELDTRSCILGYQLQLSMATVPLWFEFLQCQSINQSINNLYLYTISI